MEYMTTKEAALKWGITPRRVQFLCAEERIAGAGRLGNAWAIPTDTEKPKDERKQSKGNITPRRSEDV